jgi:hypothetical protein
MIWIITNIFTRLISQIIKIKTDNKQKPREFFFFSFVDLLY